MRSEACRRAVLMGIFTMVTAMVTAQAPNPPLTQEDMFRRNVGSPEDQETPFPPHKIVGNLYYVGTRSLAAFLVATSEGHVLINTNWERAVPGLRSSIEALGFAFGLGEAFAFGFALAFGTALVLAGADLLLALLGPPKDCLGPLAFFAFCNSVQAILVSCLRMVFSDFVFTLWFGLGVPASSCGGFFHWMSFAICSSD